MDKDELNKFKCDGILPSERLRNAAPALLEALEEIIGYAEKYPHDMGFESFAVSKARAAIAAANGEV